ncbi:MAG: hypothetical protein ACE3L7_03845 [Candidatus Pristimantibacillus sp.]
MNDNGKKKDIPGLKGQTRSAIPFAERLFNKDGKPIRVLSTSLGIALLANALIGMGPTVKASAVTEPTPTALTASEPSLVEWSNEAVKAYYDPSVDWNIPMLLAGGGALDGSEEEEEEGGASGGGSGGTTIVNHSSGFGWNDLLLYHLIFNRGNSYSSGSWHNSRNSHYTNTGAAYKTQKYSADTFQSKPVVGSAVRPKTSNSTGSITRRSTSSSQGGIGGKSSGFSSSSSSSSSSKSSSGGFGG